jgi:hypothetical protein
MDKYTIVELDDGELNLIAKLLHAFLFNLGDHAVGQRLLSDLVNQTTCIHLDPKMHGIGLPAKKMFITEDSVKAMAIYRDNVMDFLEGA